MVQAILMRLAALAALVALAAGPALAADNYPVKDGNGNTVTIKAKDTGSGIESPQTVPSDSSGNPLAATDGTANQLVLCNQEAQYDASTSGKTQIVALSSGKKIYVCGYSIFAAGTVNVDLTQGTGSNCATGTNTKMTPTYQFTAQTGFVDNSSPYGATTGPNVSIASQALCVETSAVIAVQVRVRFAQI